MTFEEDFPSLKGKIDFAGEGIGACATTKDIEESCLDKQRIRGIINRRLNHLLEYFPNANSTIDTLYSLKKELGLDK